MDSVNEVKISTEPTDMGNFRRSNIVWLARMGFLTASGGIIGPTDDYPVYAFSVYRDIIEWGRKALKQYMFDTRRTLSDDDVLNGFANGRFEVQYPNPNFDKSLSASEENKKYLVWTKVMRKLSSKTDVLRLFTEIREEIKAEKERQENLKKGRTDYSNRKVLGFD